MRRAGSSRSEPCVRRTAFHSAAERWRVVNETQGPSFPQYKHREPAWLPRIPPAQSPEAWPAPAVRTRSAELCFGPLSNREASRRLLCRHPLRACSAPCCQPAAAVLEHRCLGVSVTSVLSQRPGTRAWSCRKTTAQPIWYFPAAKEGRARAFVQSLGLYCWSLLCRHWERENHPY